MRLKRSPRRVIARSGQLACAEALEPRTLLAAFVYSELPMLAGSALRPTGVGDDGYIWGEYDSGYFLMLGYKQAPFDQHDAQYPGFSPFTTPIDAGERIIDADAPFYNPLNGDEFTLHILVADDAAGANPALISMGPNVPPVRIDLAGLPEFGAPAGSTFGALHAIASNNRGDVVFERSRTDANGTVASTWFYREGVLYYVFDGSPIGMNDADTIVSNGPDGHVWTWSSGVGMVDLGRFVATGFSNTQDHSLGASFVFGYNPDAPGQIMLARRPTVYPPGSGPPGSPTTPGPVTLDNLGGPTGAVSVRPTMHDISLTGSYVDADGRTHGFTTSFIDFTTGTPTTTFSDLNGTILNAPAGFDSNDLEYLWHEFGTVGYGAYPDLTYVSENQFYIGRRGPDGVGFLLQNAQQGEIYLTDFITNTNRNNSSAERTLDFTVYSVPFGAEYEIAIVDANGDDVLVLNGVSNGELHHVFTDGMQTIPDGQYTYELRVLVNGAVVHTDASLGVNIDTTAPVFTSVAPATGSVTYRYNPQTNEEGTDTFSYYTVHADDSAPPGLLQTALFDPDGEITFYPPASALGTPITITIRAHDKAGNTADQTVTFTVDGVATYFPEGFTGETIDEFLALVNPHDSSVNYRVNVWYEGFTQTSLAGQGTIAANSRGGLTVSTKEQWYNAPVLAGHPYAFEIISDAPLITSISHYDFGSATSETFTDHLSTSWILPAGRVEPFARDFLVWYNPSGQESTLIAQFYAEDGTLIRTVNRIAPAYQRGGLDVAGLGLPDGAYTAVITSDQPIVASLTQYLTAEHTDGPAAFMAMGVADGGSTAGALPLVLADAASNLRIYNPGAADAAITFTFTDESGGTVTHSLTIGAGLTGSLSLGDVAGLTAGARYAIAYTSDAPVAMVAVQRAHDDLVATAVADLASAGNGFLFADGFMNPDRAGVDVFETVAIYNPDATDAVEATVTLHFTDGFALSTTLQIDAGRSGFLDLHEWEALLDQGRDFNRFFYSVEIEADGPVLATMWHFDLTLGGDTPAGGFAVLGAPVDTGTPA